MNIKLDTTNCHLKINKVITINKPITELAITFNKEFKALDEICTFSRARDIISDELLWV